MAERRDRNRRLALRADEAGAEVGSFTVMEEQPGAVELDRLVSRIGERAAGALDRLVKGPFPPAGEDRAWLSLFLALQLVLGRGLRQEAGQAAALMGALIGAAVDNLEAMSLEGEEEGADEPPEPSAEASRPHVLVDNGEAVPLSLAGLPPLARFIRDRTWQLLRFLTPVLLTGDTPAVLWSRPGGAKPYQFGLGTADEVRVPLDPRHALIVARKASAGEVVRELTDRHARALNRTVAEAALEWMYYHPGSDPLERVELAPPPD